MAGKFHYFFIDLLKKNPYRGNYGRSKRKPAGRHGRSNPKRLEQYYEATVPVVEYLKQRTNFIEVDGGSSVETVTKHQ